MSKIRDVRDAIIADFKANIPHLIDVKSFGGQFDMKSLNAFSVRAPAARISWIGFSKISQNQVGQFTGPCRWGVYLVTRDKPQSPAEDQMIDLIEMMVERIEGQTWGLEYTEPARVDKVENLFTMDTNNNGIGLGGIIIEQEFAFGTDLHEEDIKSDLGYGAESLDDVLGVDVLDGTEYDGNPDIKPDDVVYGDMD